jgi:hypothetical protein
VATHWKKRKNVRNADQLSRDFSPCASTPPRNERADISFCCQILSPYNSFRDFRSSGSLLLVARTSLNFVCGSCPQRYSCYALQQHSSVSFPWRSSYASTPQPPQDQNPLFTQEAEEILTGKHHLEKELKEVPPELRYRGDALLRLKQNHNQQRAPESDVSTRSSTDTLGDWIENCSPVSDEDSDLKNPPLKDTPTLESDTSDFTRWSPEKESSEEPKMTSSEQVAHGPTSSNQHDTHANKYLDHRSFVTPTHSTQLTLFPEEFDLSRYYDTPRNDVPPFFSGYHTHIINRNAIQRRKLRFMTSATGIHFAKQIKSPLDQITPSHSTSQLSPSSTNSKNTSREHVEELILSDPVTAAAVARMENEGYTALPVCNFSLGIFESIHSHTYTKIVILLWFRHTSENDIKRLIC